MKGSVKMCSPRHHFFAAFLVLAISASCSQVLSEASSLPESTSDHPHRHRHFHHRHTHHDDIATSHGTVTSGDNDVTQALAALQVAVDLVQRNVISPADSGLTNSDDVTTESLAALETAVHKVQETFKHKSNGGGTASKLKSDDVRYDAASKLKSDDVRDDVKDDELSTTAATEDKTNRKPPYSENPSDASSQKADQTPQDLESGRPGIIMQNLQSLPRIRQSNTDHDETKHKQNEEYYDYAVGAGDSNSDKDLSVDEAKPATENSTRPAHYKGQSKIDALKNGTKSIHDKDRAIVSKIQTSDKNNGVHAENSTTNNNHPSETTTDRTASLDNDDDEDTALEDFLSWFSWVRKPAKKPKLAQPELQKPEIKEETKKPVTDSVTTSSDKVEVKKKLEDDNKEDDSWDPATEDFHYDDLEYEENGEEDGDKANSTREEAKSTRDLTEEDHHASNLSTDAAKLSAEKLKSNETVETTDKGGKPKKSGNDTFGCVGCRKLSSSLAEAQELHRQVLRAQLLDKLQLVPAFKKRPWRPKLPDQVFPQRDRSDPAHDNYYAKPTSLLIFGRDLGPRHRLRKPATGSYQFGVTGKVKSSVTSADLWIYKMKDANDVHGQTLWVTEFHLIQEHKNTSASLKVLPRRSERHRLHEHSLVARLDTHVEEGWIRFDVTRLVRRWIKGKTPESHQLLAIRCKTCHRSKYRAIFGAKSHFRPVMVLQERMGNDDDGESDDDDDYKNDEEREARHSRKKRSACDPNSTCCLFEMTVHFQDLGIHEIFHPRSIRANYCYGTCERPDLSYYNHTKITQHMRFGRTYAPYIDDALRDRLRPCCVPVVLSEASVMYYINDGLDTQVSNVPNLLVQRCGCA